MIPEIERDWNAQPAIEGETYEIIKQPDKSVVHKCRIPELNGKPFSLPSSYREGCSVGAIVKCLECGFQWVSKEYRDDNFKVTGWGWVPALDDIDQELEIDKPG